jgi:saccharopine dehydrogenase-like NADP-dependent oxidoreductase
MRTILVLGAGRSSASLVEYLLKQAGQNSWRIRVADSSMEAAKGRVGDSPHGEAVAFELQPDGQEAVLDQADVVISLLPPDLHPAVARQCLRLKKHLITASYVSAEMMSFNDEARSSGLLFLNECGLDPGIDHMTAAQMIDRIHDKGGKITAFTSFTGGLIAPETDPDNPWRYKFTWNPRNVVTAGQGTAKYLHEGKTKYIPYQQLFARITQIDVPGYGSFEGYANRDSLKYLETYHLPEVKTMLRGTLRYPGFCSAWNIFVQLGCCDDTYTLQGIERMTHSDFLESFLEGDAHESVREKLIRQMNLRPDGPEVERLEWSGFFSSEKIGMESGTPARVLEHILNKRWSLSPSDRDMIVMIHRFAAQFEDGSKKFHASLVAKGDDSVHTAMAKTVGLPMGIAASLLVQNKLNLKGVQIPTDKQIYGPVLKELEQYEIAMVEEED